MRINRAGPGIATKPQRSASTSGAVEGRQARLGAIIVVQKVWIFPPAPAPASPCTQRSPCQTGMRHSTARERAPCGFLAGWLPPAGAVPGRLLIVGAPVSCLLRQPAFGVCREQMHIGKSLDRIFPLNSVGPNGLRGVGCGALSTERQHRQDRGDGDRSRARRAAPGQAGPASPAPTTFIIFWAGPAPEPGPRAAGPFVCWAGLGPVFLN